MDHFFSFKILKFIYTSYMHDINQLKSLSRRFDQKKETCTYFPASLSSKCWNGCTLCCANLEMVKKTQMYCLEKERISKRTPNMFESWSIISQSVIPGQWGQSLYTPGEVSHLPCTHPNCCLQGKSLEKLYTVNLKHGLRLSWTLNRHAKSVKIGTSAPLGEN